jgi:hypothetical protein
MATYVNNLRLKEITTGDEDGTWGTSTNTNLELIGESLGYATQAAFASDADATTTVADGASDPARAFYFKVTSGASLTTTRTLTIAPNTVSRVMYIENATTGSQAINISQGSGANVNIANGAAKIVYLDGAGSGAAVVDANALVPAGGVTSVGGTGTVNGISLSGTVTSTGNLTLGGTLSGVNLTSQVTGTLPVANGGTGITSLGSGVATFLGTPSSANLASAVTDETGSGALVFGTSPTLSGPVLGTPASGTLTNCTADGSNKLGFLNVPVSRTTSSSVNAAATDIGKFITLTGSGAVTIPSGVFSTGDIFSIHSDKTGGSTVTTSAVNAYKGGEASTTSSITIPKNGVATFFFFAADHVIINGNYS